MDDLLEELDEQLRGDTVRTGSQQAAATEGPEDPSKNCGIQASSSGQAETHGKYLAQAAMACLRYIRTIKRRSHPRGDLLMELIPLSHHHGYDSVEQLCDTALDLRRGDPEEAVNLSKVAQTLEDIVRTNDIALLHGGRA